MLESRQDLSRLGENEERSSLDENNEIISYDDQQEELEPFDELDNFSPSAKTDVDRFRMLCDNVQNSLSEIDNSMFELLELKDNLLLQFLPANVSTRITLVISRLYRAYSLSQVPLNELIRIVHLYSQPFDVKSVVIRKFYESNEMKKRILNAALQRLSTMESNTKRHQQLKCINNWEKMYIRLALPRSNVRKWKFRLKTFRETAQLGYEHVIEWLNANALHPSSDSEVLSKDEPFDDDNEIGDGDSSGEGSARESNEKRKRTGQGSDYGDEIESDNEGSFLSSAGKQRTKRADGSEKIDQPQEEPIMTMVDVDVQATPDLDNQQTSTGDVLSTKSLIIRVYPPGGLSKTKSQCIIHTQGQHYTTNVFTSDKSNTSKTDNTKSSARATASRTKKPVDKKSKHRHVNSTTQEDNDTNTIDSKQCDQLVIPMPAVLKRRSLLDTGIDPEAIHIDILGDEKICGSVVLSPEDLRMLDLPNLHSPSFAPLVTIDDSTSNLPEPAPVNDHLDFEELSNDLYKSWISRTPQTFTVYNDKREPIGKLPLHMFWYNKVEITHATKCTMTAPMQARTPTPKTVYVTQMSPPDETPEKTFSLVVIPPTAELDESSGPFLTDFPDTGDHVEIIKATYEDKIVRLHENYQAEIRRLKRLLEETPSRLSNEMVEISELDENSREVIGEEPTNINTEQQARPQSKREVSMDHQPSSVYGKDLPKTFLDRYQMYLERSIENRHRLMTKVEQETARAMERQMEIQHRLHKSEDSGERYDDLCLPAVFMPFRSGNVFNPRAYRFFHHTGSSDPRLTQTPTIFKLPPLPSGSVSVLNLFELSRCYEPPNDKEPPADQTTSQVPEQPRPLTSSPTQPPN